MSDEDGSHVSASARSTLSLPTRICFSSPSSCLFRISFLFFFFRKQTEICICMYISMMHVYVGIDDMFVC